MQTIFLSLPKAFVFVLFASTLLLTQEPATPASPPQTSTPAQGEPKHEEQSNPASSPSPAPAQPGTTSPQANEPAKSPTATAQPLLSPQKRAWQILNTACTGQKASSRALATRVL